MMVLLKFLIVFSNFLKLKTVVELVSYVRIFLQGQFFWLSPAKKNLKYYLFLIYILYFALPFLNEKTLIVFSQPHVVNPFPGHKHLHWVSFSLFTLTSI